MTKPSQSIQPADIAMLPPLKDCRVMVCNDDGFESEGIRILLDTIRSFSDDVWLVAPNTNQSARSRAYSIAQDVRVRQLDDRRFAVDGTPVDCAIVGLNGLIPGRRPDLVLSGVNEGTNLAEDIPVSGTIGACMEAVDQGIPAIAFSQVGTYQASEGGTWLATQEYLHELLPKLVGNLGPELPLLNVNFPQLKSREDLRGIKIVPSGRRPPAINVMNKVGNNADETIYYFDLLREDRGTYPDSDIHLALNGYVTITPLAWSPTNYSGLTRVELN